MIIEEIFDAFKKIGCVTFTTLNQGYPVSRMVDFLTYDEDGLYFFTMKSKPFYKQLKESGTISVCGLSANPELTWIDEKTPVTEPGYFIRISGDVREFTIEDAKAKQDPRFDYLIYDNSRYPLITGFCIHRFHGEIYDYDFDKLHRDHKLERERFSFGDIEVEKAGLTMDSGKCISCGKCEKVCTFSAIYKVEHSYAINGDRCDECGNCYVACPVGAITHKGN